MATNNKGTYRKTTYWDGSKSRFDISDLVKGADDDPAFEVFSEGGHVMYDFAGETGHICFSFGNRRLVHMHESGVAYDRSGLDVEDISMDGKHTAGGD